MLKELKIKNFAIINQLSVDFNSGLNIISGETGAGKSVVITALELALGSKASSEYIRSGTDHMLIEAAFLISSPDIKQKLEKYGIDNDDDILILRRRLSRQGKSTSYANGCQINLTVLNDIGQELVDIHGQHQHQLLLRPETHLEFLDNFANLLPQRQKLSEMFNAWQNILKKLTRLEEQKRQQAMKKELLSFQLQEIEQADLCEGEEESLRNERGLLLNAGKILETGQWIYQSLYAADGAVSETLTQIKNQLNKLGQINAELAAFGESAASLKYQAEELASSLNDYLDNIEYNPARHQEIEERLSLIEDLKRKYGNSIEDILRFREKTAAELNALSNANQTMEDLNQQRTGLEKELEKTAAVLSGKRRQSAAQLESLMEKELAQLGMPRAAFKINLSPVAGNSAGYSGNAQGMEQADFLFSANPGEQPKALVKIASGGELSRIMLALKGLLAGNDRVGCLVFDEVDVGIGGKIAEVVGKKLKQSAAFRQVICITHLPQIAALAEHHYTVSKQVHNGQTFTDILYLGMPGRIKEIARMLAGEEITPTALTHAQEMVKGKKQVT